MQQLLTVNALCNPRIKTSDKRPEKASQTLKLGFAKQYKKRTEKRTVLIARSQIDVNSNQAPGKEHRYSNKLSD